MNLTEGKNQLLQLQRELWACANAQKLFMFDAVTAAPSGSAPGRNQTTAALESLRYRRLTEAETVRLLNYLQEHADGLDARERRMLTLLLRSQRRLVSIPKEEYDAAQKLLAETSAAWYRAKKESDFSIVKPLLEGVVRDKIRFAHYIAPDKQPFDVCLEGYEEGLTAECCDAFFDRLLRRLLPLVQRLTKSDETHPSAEETYPLEGQRDLSRYVMGLMHVPLDHCVLAVGGHPATYPISKQDVRITTRYDLKDFALGMRMAMHESGHAMYELHTAPEDAFTELGTFVSMSVHESQSRFYETLVGSSEEFIESITPKLQELFPKQLSEKTAEEIYRIVNRCHLTPIRMEADELTYPVHIIIRYELEKALINGELSVEELPEAWNALYHRYLNIDVRSNAEGVLQDNHWSRGSFGYFPTYVLGSAYAAQMMHAMRRELDVSALIRSRDLLPVNEWLEEHVWKYGKLFDTDELLKKVTGEGFNPDYYIKYLTEKYERILQ